MFWINRSFKLFLFLNIFLIANCKTPSKKIQKNIITQEQIDKMDQALSLIEDKQFLKGALIYDELIEMVKNHNLKSLLLFNSGTAYKEAKQCEKALNRFRRLLDHSLKNSPFKARGLIEISYIYECIGDREASFVSLKSAEKFRKQLPWTLNHVIFPARLAIAYAGVGQISKAKHYKSLSLTRVLKSKSIFSSEKDLNKQASRMFYLMGRSYVKKEKIDPHSFFNVFSYHQIYLLQSMFLKDKIWSKIAKQELILLFDNLKLAITQTKNIKKYKKTLLQNINSAHELVRKEKSPSWNLFYNQQSQPILKLLAKVP